MKTVALISLSTGIIAAIAGIIIQSLKIVKNGKADKWSKGVIIFASLFMLFAIANIILVILYF